MTFVPFIPDSAPFSEEQRAWLNGFLAGIFSGMQAGAAVDPPASLKIAVLYGTQSGTAEGLARKVVKDLKAKGHVASLASLEGYTPAALAEERYAILIASTYGEGDPPDAVQPFFQQLCVERFPRYQDLSYAVLALGDSHYEHFCKFGADFDNKLASLGAVRITPRVDCDVDLDASFAEWKKALYARLDEIVAARPARNAPSSSLISPTTGGSSTPSGGSLPSPSSSNPAAGSYSRENPFLAPLVEKRPLTAGDSSKLTMHMTFSIADSDLQYQAGDACGVIPQNDRRLVDEIIDSLKFSP
ncbi:MAG TPA: flavodoxin domain-containing protein, partial [Acidobacteriaceae bacterium]|nr:flavodoxin domain-containing protein [Acidobacteriaceae bacterium]